MEKFAVAIDRASEDITNFTTERLDDLALEILEQKQEKVSASGFRLSQRSLNKLHKVHPLLTALARTAIQLTEVDFGITEGLRTAERQKELFEQGRSQLDGTDKISYHQMRESGYAQAIDVAAFIKGSGYVWEHDPYFKICEAFVNAMQGFDEFLTGEVKCRWGGSWSFMGLDFDPKAEQQAYIERKAKKGKRCFIDMPHIELHVQ